ncbi:MAG: gamma-glutamyltransferase [Gemmatimonadota bacterium]|nr:MAG: gamma-glutamyltransferase [Gemmatimonadota bacterium]
MRSFGNLSRLGTLLLLGLVIMSPEGVVGQRTMKPVLHGRHWMAITGKPLGATAGAMMFQRGGNAVDAACAMLGATATMWDVLSWGGETQALIFNPNTGRVIGINALGVAPTGATVEFFKGQEMPYPPEYGPLAAVTPGTPGGLMVMLAEYGTLSLEDVLAPSLQMAEGYPIEQDAVDRIERSKERIKQWRYSRELFLPHLGGEHEGPQPGEIFRQPDLAVTLRKLVEAEQQALAEGKSRKEAIYAAYDRFYRGDIAEEFVRGSQEEGGLHTMADLDKWEVYIEEPVSTRYKGIDVYKLTTWVQGPVLLQALNMLENIDLQEMGYNSTRYIHTLYQVMNLAFADRDFYYGDPYFPPVEPIEGLLSKDYARKRAALIDWEHNDPDVGPGDPYPFQGSVNPYLHLLQRVESATNIPFEHARMEGDREVDKGFFAGTTSIQAADEEGWVVSITPSGGWIPATIAGRTGVGMSQRMQSFVLDESINPYNMLEPGKRPRATLTPSLALKDGKPFLSFAVQGGDSQDQNLLQFFLNVVEFGMDVQQAAEAANITSYQLRSSFGEHNIRPGRLTLNESVPPWVRAELETMGYDLNFESRTSGPINAIFFDWEHGSFWGGSSHHGDDYGIAW